MNKWVLFLVAFSLTNLSANDKILGKWLTPNGKSNVEMFKCGEAVCGKIISLKEPNDVEGKPKVDKENPDPSKKSQPIVGLTFLKGFKFDSSENEFTSGEIYDPETGKTYVGEIKLDGDKLKLNGHLKISKFIGKEQTWTRLK